MQRTLFITIFVGLLTVSCGTAKKNLKSEKIDSVRIVREVEYIEKVRDTIIYVSLPVETREVIRRDSSELETKIAVSRAKIMADGYLYHTLDNKPLKLPAEVNIKETEITKDNIKEIIRYEYIEVPVKIPLNKFQSFLHISGYGFWFMLIGLIIFRVVFKHRI